MENYGSAMTQNAKQNNYIGTQAEKQKEGDSIADRLASHATHLRTVVERLDGLSDRILGPRPREAANPCGDQTVAARVPFASRLNATDSRLHGSLEEADRILGQLESFV